MHLSEPVLGCLSRVKGQGRRQNDEVTSYVVLFVCTCSTWDLKTSNILLNNGGEVKICDFGLSRQYGSPLKPYTQLAVTLWYRAPELLLGAKEYSTAIDMWSLGRIMAELLTKEPLFNGKRDIDLLITYLV